MKKLFVLFGIMTFISSASFAYYFENETLNPEVLDAQGYSDSTIVIADKVHALNAGLNGNYQRRYKLQHKNKLGKAYYYLKNYIDPLQDDGLFCEHQINFSNTWADGTTFYTTPERPVKGVVEDL